MSVSEESMKIVQVSEEFPSWGGRSGCYYIKWRFPDLVLRSWEKVAACPKLQSRIVELCQTILDSDCFDIDWVQFRFHKDGITIDVPGSACDIYTESSGLGKEIGNHNIDTLTQVFSLYFFLISAITEIYSTIPMWVDNPSAGIEGNPTEHQYRLNKNPERKKQKLWSIEDDQFRTIAAVFGRTQDEAQENARKVGLDDYDLGILPIRENEFPILSPLRMFTADVFLEDMEGIKPARQYHVIAVDSDHAEEMVKEKLKQDPLLFPIKDILIKEVGNLQPSVL